MVIKSVSIKHIIVKNRHDEKCYMFYIFVGHEYNEILAIMTKKVQKRSRIWNRETIIQYLMSFISF